MAKVSVILARADSSCGKVFHPDRRAAEEHRIVLEVWNRATGRNREGYRLAVFQCMRCGGFHVSQKRADRVDAVADPFFQRIRQEALDQVAASYAGEHEPLDDYELEDEAEPAPIAPRAREMVKTVGNEFHLERCAATSYFGR